jgi:hypothetical protein
VTIYAAERKAVEAAQGGRRLRHRTEGKLVRLKALCNREVSVRFNH